MVKILFIACFHNKNVRFMRVEMEYILFTAISTVFRTGHGPQTLGKYLLNELVSKLKDEFDDL